MFIHARLDASRVNGPGCRAVLFVQGCRIGCRNCWNVLTHPDSGAEFSVQELADWILRLWCDRRINGVTLSGGEPMHQVAELCELIEGVKTDAPGISIGMFSGYYERELENGCYWTRSRLSSGDRSHLWQRLQLSLDFGVLGRYVPALATLEPLRTSSNQSLRLFTPRYTQADFTAPEVEVTLGADGFVQITGFPTAGLPA
jgi:anaerobic ribonucleoside-triphosphate reductase activating protein